MRDSVSLNIQNNFLRPAFLGDTVTIMAFNKKIGKNIGLANMEIYDSSNRLLSTG